MDGDPEFEPAAIHVVDDPEQLKAFTDRLRVRVLSFLIDRAATNQQTADALGEPQAKVLYHLRVLLESGLIRLVDTRIRGGNVEKYYRAVARSYELHPDPELRGPVVAAEMEMLRDEMIASTAAHPDPPLRPRLLALSHELTPEQAERLFARVRQLVEEELGPLDAPRAPAEGDLYTLGVVLFRNANQPNPDD